MLFTWIFDLFLVLPRALCVSVVNQAFFSGLNKWMCCACGLDMMLYRENTECKKVDATF